MSNLRASAYLCLLLSIAFLFALFAVGMSGDWLLRLVFLSLAIVLGVIGVILNQVSNRRKKKVRTLF